MPEQIQIKSITSNYLNYYSTISYQILFGIYIQLLIQMTCLPTIILLFSLCLATLAKDREIGERSILLPVDYGSTHRVQHLVEAYGGCYVWTTNEPSVLKIDPIKTDKQCESRALIEVQKEGAFVGSLSVSATDRETGEVIKAIVRLSKLERIEILTKFRIMNLYQVQQFYLIGYDELGNSFSSLEGLKFQWSLDQRGRVGEKITIRESNIFQQTNYRRVLEESGYETDMLVVKALNIGEIQLSVRLNEPNYEHISTSIRLSVQERFDIIPSSPVYMLAGSKFKFNLLNIRGEQINLPTSYYSFKIGQNFKTSDDLTVASPSIETNTRLVVQDTRTHPPYTNEVDIQTLHADDIEIIAKSYVIAGEPYPFKISLFNNRRLLKGGAAVDIESDFFLDMANSSFIAREKETGTIKVTYKGLTHEKRIIANLKLKPVLIGDKIVLPPGQTFELKIIGGSGSYDFSLIDSHDVAFIHQSGIISTKNPGKAKVLVVDNNDHNNRVEVELIVDRVASVKSFDEKLETGLGDEITALAIAKPQNQRQYTQCNQLPISIFENDLIQSLDNKDLTLETILKIHQNARENPELSNVLDIFRQGRNINLNDYRDYIVKQQIQLKDLQKILFAQDNFGICKAFKTKPLSAREGEAQFKIQGEKDYTSTPFKVKIYDHLEIKDHTSSRILLVPGSNFIWRPENGGEESIYYLNDIRIKQNDPIVLSCSEPGEKKQYDIKVLHQISQKLPRPFTRYIKITVQCLRPSALKFKIDDNILESGQLYSSDDEPFVVQLRGFDHLGRQFYNISSLDFSWNLDGVKKTDVSPKDNIYQFSFLNSKTLPHVNVKTSGSRYNGVSFPEIEANLDVTRTEPFQLLLKGKPVTKSLVLLASPNQKHFIQIRHGSNNFEIKCPHPELLKCSLNSNSKTIEITPLKRGNTKLLVTDVQQNGRPFFEVHIKIVNPIRLRLDSNVTLAEQNSGVELRYEVLGEDDLVIDQTQYEYLGLVTKYDCDVERIDSNTFRVLRKGRCSVSGVIPEYNIASNIVDIEVFPKFSINIPRVFEQEKEGVRYYSGDVKIPYGCNSSLVFLGGPFGIGKLTYEANPSNIVEIQQLNLRTFRLIGRKRGNTNLRFVLRDGDTDINIVNIRAVVKDIDSIELTQGNRQIYERATVRLIPEILIDGERILSSQCPIRYEWKTDNSDVIQIKGLNTIDSNLGLNITGLRRGYAKIQLTPIYSSRLPKQETFIEVIEAPTVDLSTFIHHGKVQPTSLLIPPNSGYTFNSSFNVEIVSPCENLMKIVGNDVDTFNDKGGSVLKLRTLGRDNSVSYMSVHVERIHSVMIDNPLGRISIQKDTEIKVPFYVLDSFGRLFPNNLKGIQYEVRITDPSVASAQISEDNEEIILRGIYSGHADIYLSILGQPNIFDVVSLQTMILITPVSPVSVHVGGSVDFKILKSGVGEWASDNPFLLQIDKRTGKSLALREGSTQISYIHGLQYKSRVNVFRALDIHLKQSNELLSNYKGEEQQLQLVVLADKGKGVTQLRDFNQPLHEINNNLVVKCSSLYPLWFQVQCSILSISDKQQTIFVYPKAAKTYPNDQMPNELEFQVKLESGTLGETFLTRSIVHPFIFEFRLPKHQHHISLNAREKVKILEIQTNNKLGVYSEFSRSNWLSTEFIPSRSLQILKIDLSDENENLKTSIKLINHMTKQTDQITVNYSPSSYSQSTGGILEWAGLKWSWTNVIILFMVGVIASLFICACLNKDDMFYSRKDD